MQLAVTEVVIFGVGSSLLVDTVESLARASVAIRAGIRNHPGECFLPPDIPVLPVGEIGAPLLDLPFIVPFFTPGDRQMASGEATAFGFRAPYRLVDPTAIVPGDLSLGEGGYINAGCVLGSGSRFDAFVFVNRGATIGHHARVGRYVSIGPGAVLAGNITVGDGAVIGAGAVVLPDIRIGANAVVGAGAVVTRDVPNFCIVAGNPARIVRRNDGGFGGQTVA